MKQQTVIEFLKRHKFDYRVVEHRAVFTVEESAGVLEEKVPTKCLLLKDIKSAKEFMVVMRGAKRLDMKLLAERLQAKKLQFVKPERVEELAGVKPGSVSVFGLLHEGAVGLTVVLDSVLFEEPELGFHPNVNTATVFMKTADVLRAINKMGFRPVMISLEE